MGWKINQAREMHGPRIMGHQMVRMVYVSLVADVNYGITSWKCLF